MIKMKAKIKQKEFKLVVKVPIQEEPEFFTTQNPLVHKRNKTTTFRMELSTGYIRHILANAKNMSDWSSQDIKVAFDTYTQLKLVEWCGLDKVPMGASMTVGLIK